MTNIGKLRCVSVIDNIINFRALEVGYYCVVTVTIKDNDDVILYARSLFNSPNVQYWFKLKTWGALQRVDEDGNEVETNDYFEDAERVLATTKELVAELRQAKDAEDDDEEDEDYTYAAFKYIAENIQAALDRQPSCSAPQDSDDVEDKYDIYYCDEDDTEGEDDPEDQIIDEGSRGYCKFTTLSQAEVDSLEANSRLIIELSNDLRTALYTHKMLWEDPGKNIAVCGNDFIEEIAEKLAELNIGIETHLKFAQSANETDALHELITETQQKANKLRANASPALRKALHTLIRACDDAEYEYGFVG